MSVKPAPSPPTTWEELDSKLREGVQQDADEKIKQKTHQAFEKALVEVLPEEFEIPETLIENVAKERFASMLADMRERGSSDEQLKELVTPENYERAQALAREPPHARPKPASPRTSARRMQRAG